MIDIKSRVFLVLTFCYYRSYGLAWSPHKHNANHLLSAGFDSKICQWDIAGTTKENNELEPVRTYTAHTTGVEVSLIRVVFI
jgi:hypothetical protein